MASAEAARQAEQARTDLAHRGETEALQRRLAEEQAAASERLSSEVGKLRKEHEKAIAAAREEQAVQLASERQAYEALTEQKERDHRNEILAMRRRQEEELTAAEDGASGTSPSRRPAGSPSWRRRRAAGAPSSRPATRSITCA